MTTNKFSLVPFQIYRSKIFPHQQVAATYSAKLWHSQTHGKVVENLRGWIADSLVVVIFQVGVILTIVTDKTRGQDEHLDEYIRC